jgi:hypothetical protein
VAGLEAVSERLQSICCYDELANQVHNTEFVLQQLAVLHNSQMFVTNLCFTLQSLREPANGKEIRNACPQITTNTTASQSQMLWIQLKQTDKSGVHR